MALRDETGAKVKRTRAEMREEIGDTTVSYKPTWEQEQNVLSFRKLLMRRHLMRWIRATEGAFYVPFMGDGDIAVALYGGRMIYGADLDPDRVITARSRLPHAVVREFDCDMWPFPDIDAPIALADFDAYSEPYTSFRSFWKCATKADRLVVCFTDGHRQGLVRTGWLDHPSGEKIKLGEGYNGDPLVKRPIYNSYLSKHIWPWFDELIAPDWKLLDRWRYQRDMMIYWGMAIERR